MKPFNLEEALQGKPCITRDGKKAIILYDNCDYDVDYPLSGIIYNERGEIYGRRLSEWDLQGKYRFGEVINQDIIGMWEEDKPQPFVSISFPAPLKSAKQGQKVFYLVGNVAQPMTFVDTSEHRDMLFNGNLFKTKADAITYLNEMREAKR